MYTESVREKKHIQSNKIKIDKEDGIKRLLKNVGFVIVNLRPTSELV